VRQVLDAFYAKVFADAQLAPYFQFTTPHHVASKQYAFLYESMTGEDMYFGDRPYNAHHAMVISHALFDHRQHLMVQTLAEHGLSDDHIRRWTVFEESYREHIVKTQALPRMGKAGLESRPDGFGHETLSEGAVCDHCGAVIEAGTTVLYHRRLGTVSCPACAPASAAMGQ
jgi:truncated hemoglobin YjbI